MNYHFAYLLGTICIGLPVWLIFYFLRRDVRKELLFMTLFGLLISPPLVSWYIKDYWRPETITGNWLSVEDLLFGSLATGISAVIYQVLSHKSYSKKQFPKRPWIILLFVALNLGAYFLPVRVNSIYLTSGVSLLCAFVMCIKRPDLIRVAVFSGILVTIFWLMSYIVFLPIFPGIFQRWWMLENLSGHTLLSIPIEEFIWSMSWGMFAGILYKFIVRKTIK